jgi:hypothetical protein
MKSCPVHRFQIQVSLKGTTPALINIAGMQELCAWIECVHIAKNGGSLGQELDRLGFEPFLTLFATSGLVSMARSYRVRRYGDDRFCFSCFHFNPLSELVCP